MANRIEVIVATDLTDGVCMLIRCTGTVRVRFCEGSELLGTVKLESIVSLIIWGF